MLPNCRGSLLGVVFEWIPPCAVGPELDEAWQQLGLAALLILCGLVLVALVMTRLGGHRSRALLRLDWFVPMLRRQPGHAHSRGLMASVLRKLLPAFLFSNHQTKQRGWIRRKLRQLGISWLASPVRRATQATCLLIFLALFLYVCWPYSARPRAPVLLVDGLTFEEIDQNSGELIFDFASSPQAETLAEDSSARIAGTEQPTSTLFLVRRALSQTKSLSREVQWADSDSARVRVQPVGELDDAWLDALLTDTGASWQILDRDPNGWPAHYTEELAQKELLPAELFLAIDPLVSLSTAIASRSWVWSLASAGLILVVCLVIPRGFCGYLCPLGTTIDLFDWAIGKRVTRFRVPADGWWVHIKYYLLTATLIAACFGVLVSGFFSAIPVITRAALMLIDPIQTGFGRGWHLIPAMNLGHFVSIGLFLVVLGLGFLRPRFWCKYVCPSGAVFSLGNIFRLTERKVESSCIHCNKCVEICPFDAIKPDFTTRETDCTLCQSCAGVCPTHAIKFVERGNKVELKVLNEPETHETAIGRRGFLSLASGSAAAVVGGAAMAGSAKLFGANQATTLPVRPPGSVPEPEFLEMCIRCGECFKVCPNNVLQVQGFDQGLEGLWTPVVRADWAGCESSCNACGQVCPTGAIRALPLEEKRHARMGLAIVNQATCLPIAGKEACDLCVQECIAAGYEAIEYEQVGTEVDAEGQPIEGTGFLAPVVLEDKCVGCGLCQTRCYGINVKERHILEASAIVIEAGEGKEDRLLQGSYVELHQEAPESAPRPIQPQVVEEPPPDFGENPFGLE